MKWERGYRCHGFWEGIKRIAVISLGPYGFWDGVYNWEIDETRQSGEELTLKKAKIKVETILCRGN